MHPPQPAADAEPLTPVALAVYRECAREPQTADQLRLRLSTTSETIASALIELSALGLVEPGTDVIAALAPFPFEREIERQDRHLRDLRRIAGELDGAWLGRGAQHWVDVIEGDLQARALIDELVASARVSIDGLSVGPILPLDPLLPTAPLARAATLHGERDALARGVAVRGIYDVGLMSNSEALAAVQDCIRLGEDARVAAGLPIHLLIFDTEVVAMPVPGIAGDRRHLLVTRHRGVVRVLADLFESFWRMAIAIPRIPDTVPELDRPDPETSRLLTYLAAGLTDEAIARTLGVSGRTVGRRIANLEALLGARSRFQLATQAARRGWL